METGRITGDVPTQRDRYDRSKYVAIEVGENGPIVCRFIVSVVICFIRRCSAPKRVGWSEFERALKPLPPESLKESLT